MTAADKQAEIVARFVAYDQEAGDATCGLKSYEIEVLRATLRRLLAQEAKAREIEQSYGHDQSQHATGCVNCVLKTILAAGDE